MKNIKFLLALPYLIMTINIFAQSPSVRKFSKTSYILQNAQVMPTNAVADDFGPRNLEETYWHGGIDFNSIQNDGNADMWDLIISPQAGIIPDFDRLTHGTDVYKYGLVNINDDEGNGSHTLLFGHVFDWHKQFYDEFGRRIVLKRCEGDDDDKWGLHLFFTNAQGNPIRHTYGQINGATLNVNGTNYTTTNQVNTTDIFIPLGRSGGKPNPDPNGDPEKKRFKAHLHLNTLPYNTSVTGSLPTSPNGDPTQFLNIDRPDYRITAISEGSNEAVGVLMKYPGTNLTKIKARTYMIGEADKTYRYNHLMDMDKVELQIKKSYITEWERIKGDKNEAIISEGGRLGEAVINHSNPVNKSDWRKTGINSNAYNAATDGPNARNPWDDYYFTDFYSRIHKNDIGGNDNPSLFSDIPFNTRYNDGKYDFRAKTTTSYNGITFSNVQTINIDNFLPYIANFQLKIGSNPGSSTVFYEIERKQNEGDADQYDDGYVTNEEHYYKIGQPSPTSKYYIEINTSEPVTQLSYKVRKKDQEFPYNSTLMTQIGNSKMIWRAELPLALFITSQDELEFEITGNDLANNKLVNIAEMSKLIVDFNLPGYKIKIPTRKTNERSKLAWNNYPSKIGLDRFKVKMSGCLRSSSQEICDAIKLMEASKARYDCSSVRLELENYFPTANVTWTNENGDEISYNPFINVSSVGRYCYKILGEFGDDCCSKEGCIFVVADDFEDKSIEISPIIDPGCGPTANQRGHVSVFHPSYPTGTAYSWSHNPGLNASWTRVEPGEHSVTVTMPWGCKRSLNYVVEQAETAIQIYEDIVLSDCGQNNGEIHIITNVYEEENTDLSVLWSNGSTERSLYSLSPGQYCVTVTPVNTACPMIKCYSVPERSIEINAFVTPNTECDGQYPNGRIELTVPNGIEPLTVTWADGSPDGLLREPVRVGSYLVTVTDANNCTARQMINVPGTETLTFSNEISQDCSTNLYKIRLFNFPNNYIYIVSLYKWINGVKEFQSYYPASNGYQIVGLNPGKYTLETTEFPCKFGSVEVDLPEPFTLLDAQTVENMGCIAGEEDGEISLYFEGGLRPLTISIGSQSQTVMGNSATFTSLNGGLHFITFTNPSNCFTWSFTAMLFQTMDINETITQPQGPNHNPPPSNGSIELQIIGGSGQFEFEWTRNNVFYSTEKDIFNLMPGYYSVKVIDQLTGCIFVKNYYLSANICKRTLSCTIHGTDKCPPGPNQNIGDCLIGCPKDIHLFIGSANSFNQLDYQLPITVTVTHVSGFNSTKTYSSLNPIGTIEALFFGLPVDTEPYTINITDACGNSITKTIFTCSKCQEILHDPQEQGPYVLISDNPGTINFEINNWCKYSGWPNGSNIKITYMSLAPGQEYDITWIDGVTKTTIHRNGTKTKIKKGNKRFKFTPRDFDGTLKTVLVERNDGCVRDFKFRLGDKIQNVAIYSGILSELGNYSIGDFICTQCNLLETIPARNLFIETRNCPDIFFTDYERFENLFHYIPSKHGNPCVGGILERHIPTSDDALLNHKTITTIDAFKNQTQWVGRHKIERKDNFIYILDGGGCIYAKEIMFPDSPVPNDMYVNWFRLKKEILYNQNSTLECGKILNITKSGYIYKCLIDPGDYQSRFKISDGSGNIIQDWPIEILGSLYEIEFNAESYLSNNFTFIIDNTGPCGDETRSIDSYLCPDKFEIIPYNLHLGIKDVYIEVYSPRNESIIGAIEVYYNGPDGKELAFSQTVIEIKPGDNTFNFPDYPFETDDFEEGEYIFEIHLGATCDVLTKTIQVNNFTGNNDGSEYKCDDEIIDIGYDSIKNEFNYFIGIFNSDSIYGETFTFDTLSGFFNEFTRHEIEWDWVRHVRYDSTKTVYYFGTDSIFRSFVTSIDTNGVSNTTWFQDIIFVSCGPLNPQGIWTLVGYKVSEQKYYMYQFDKVNLTPLPLDIPNDNRGQTYTTVWNFGPDEYTTKIVSGSYEILKFFSSAYPPFEVSLPRPFKIKTVTKWASNQWLVTGDLKGTLVIAGDTLVSEEWIKSVFIWYDWTGTVIKYKIIESEEERIITHVATDGYRRIFFTGMEIDTIFHENPDSITIETCIFGDTLTVEATIQSFRPAADQNTSLAVVGEVDDFLRFYPNPFNQGIHVVLDAKKEDNVVLTAFGMTGHQVFTKDWQVLPGRNELYLREFETLPAGLYSVLVKTSSSEHAVRVVKVE